MSTRLTCISPDAAVAVVAEWSAYGGAANNVKADGSGVVIDYFDKRYPLDVADWAFQNGHAHDADAACVMAGL